MINNINKILRSKSLSLTVISLLTLIVYSCMLVSPFKTMDDEISIVQNLLLRDVSNIPVLFFQSFFGGHSYYRPLVSFSYMSEYHICGLNPFFYYFNNLLIHLLVSLSIYFLISLLTKKNITAFFTSLLFAIHPIHWEGVTNIPGRAILLATLFSVNAFYFFCRSDGNKRSPFYALSLFLFVLGLLSKESAFMLPAILCSYLYFVENKNLKQTTSLVLPFFLIDVLYLFLRKLLNISNVLFQRTPAEMLFDFVTFLRSVITHLRMLIFPDHLFYDRTQGVITEINFSFIATIVFFILAGYALYKLKPRISKLTVFFLTWFCVELFPVSQIAVPIKVITGYIAATDHFLYSASIGYFVIVVFLFEWIARRNETHKYFSRDVFYFLVGGILLFYFLTTVKQNFVSRNQIVMFEGSLKENPKNNRVRNSLALAYAKIERFDKTEENYRKVLEINPFDAHARIGLGKSLCDQGRLWEGLDEYDRVADAGSLQDLLENNIRLTQQILINQNKKAILNDPSDSQAHYHLGVLYLREHRADRAEKFLLKAIELRPNFKNAIYNLAILYEGVNNYNEAIRVYEQLIAIEEPRDIFDYHSFIRLGELWGNKGDLMRSRDYFQKAEELKRTFDERI